MKWNLSKIFLLVVLFFSFCTRVNAFDFYSVETEKIDTTLYSTENINYSNPAKIYIAQVSTSSDDLARDPMKWVQTLYYYSITRLKLSNIPYAYLLDENGMIYQGNSNALGADVGFLDESGVILIGYLSNRSSFTSRAESSLYKVVDEIAKRWGITEVAPVKLTINKSDTTISTISSRADNSEFGTVIKDIFKDWKGYKEEDLDYKAKLVSVDYEKTMTIGQRSKVTVVIQNNNDFIWFTDKSPIYVSTADGKDSEFAINKKWVSFSRPVGILDKVVKPGESVTLEFEMQGKFSLGDVSEDFVFVKDNGTVFDNTTFTVTLSVDKGENSLVVVSSPEYGFVNIRSCAGASCNLLDTAEDGEMFILLESTDSGWSKIRFNLDQEGWVATRYLKNI
ncbi:SH3 domain-containing protein [bacterium]|nr:SH3 domain-containing protein [bacterium]